MSYELKQYSFGQTIGKGFNLYFDNFIPIVLLSLLCKIPAGFYTYFFKASVTAGSTRFLMIMAGLVGVGINIMMEAFLSAYIINLVSKKILGSESLYDSHQSSSIGPLILPVFGLSMLGGILVIIGMVALVIPGIIISLGLSVATEALVIERCGISGAMSRSWDLTKGKKGEIFGLFIVSGLILLGISLPFLVVFNLLNLGAEITEYLKLVVSAITSPIQACMIVVIYFNLRIEKEGFNVEHLVQQFSLPEGSETINI